MTCAAYARLVEVDRLGLCRRCREFLEDHHHGDRGAGGLPIRRRKKLRRP